MLHLRWLRVNVLKRTHHALHSLLARRGGLSSSRHRLLMPRSRRCSLHTIAASKDCRIFTIVEAGWFSVREWAAPRSPQPARAPRRPQQQPPSTLDALQPPLQPAYRCGVRGLPEFKIFVEEVALSGNGPHRALHSLLARRGGHGSSRHRLLMPCSRRCSLRTIATSACCHRSL